MKEVETNHSYKSRRIANNSILLLVRMVILTLLNLYIVRLVLNGLGNEDYGVYNVVASVVTVIGCLNSVVAMSIQRFLSFHLGNNSIQEVQKVYSVSINIIIFLVIIVILLGESLGRFFYDNILIIPQSRCEAAYWVFHSSILSYVFSLLQIPFIAILIAEESMGKYAYISILDSFLKLVVAIVIQFSLSDNLIVYGVCMAISSFVVLIVYIWSVTHYFPRYKYRKVKDCTIYKRIFSFASWSMFGAIANIGLIQGSTLLLNYFFTPLINSAFAIAIQIYNAFSTLCNTMFLPLRPAMIKSYSQKDYSYLNEIFYFGNKLASYVLVGVSIPLLLEMDTIIKFWLSTNNEHFVLFARLMVVYVIILGLNNPITTIIQATGKVKQYHLSVETFTLLSLPMAWFLFNKGLPPYYIFVCMISVVTLAHGIRLVCLQRYYAPFSIRTYLYTIIIPLICICIIVAYVNYYIHQCVYNAIQRLVIVLPMSLFLTASSAFVIGLDKRERGFVKVSIMRIIKRR